MGIQRVEVRQQLTCQAHSPVTKHPPKGRCRRGPQTVPHRGPRPQRLTSAYKTSIIYRKRCRTRLKNLTSRLVTSGQCHGLRNAIEHLVRNGQLHQYCTPTTGVNAIEVHGQILTLHGGAPRLPPRQSSVKRQCTTPLEVFDIQRGVTIAPSAWDQVTFRKGKDTINCHHSESFIINVQIDHYRCHRALVDTGAVVNVMFADCYRGLRRD
ncbi:hypothetical protein ACLB2K_058550 [Fragaria x ananassa]